MPIAQSILNPVTSPTGRDAPARALIDRQMARLERLAEIGMEIAEAAGRMARQIEAGGAGAEAADPALSYSRAARAVRLTIALQSRLAKDLAGLDRDEAAARAGEASRRRHDIHRRIKAVAEAERDGTDEVEQIAFDAWERLTDADDADILDQPIELVVAHICADLGLSPAFTAGAFAAANPAEPKEDGDPALDRRLARSRASPGLRPQFPHPGEGRDPGLFAIPSDPPPKPGSRLASG